MRSEPLLAIPPYGYFFTLAPALGPLPLLHSLVADPSLKGSIKSSGFGTGAAGLAGAIGEYFERFHFITSTPTACRKFRIRDLQCGDLERSLHRLLTGESAGELKAEDHLFTMCQVSSIYTETEFWYPACLITLSARSADLNIDRRFLPLSDSCGCAAHSSLHAALVASLCEFVERQSVIVCWQYGHGHYEIDPVEDLLREEVLAAYQYLKVCGTVRVFEISAVPDISAVLCLFKSHAGSNFPIKYSVGSSASPNPRAAVGKAIKECYHALFAAFYLQKEFADPAMADNEQNIYTKRFIECSSKPQVFDEFAITTRSLARRSGKELDRGPAPLEKILNNLREMSPYLFFFARRLLWGGRELFVTKIFSPDFYVSMNLPATNLENRFADRFRNEVKYQYGIAMPFP